MLDKEMRGGGTMGEILRGSGQGKMNPTAREQGYPIEGGGENYPGNNVFLPVEYHDGNGRP